MPAASLGIRVVNRCMDEVFTGLQKECLKYYVGVRRILATECCGIKEKNMVSLYSLYTLIVWVLAI